MINEKIRNVAIIAHVDHGKTSIVNEMLKQGNVFRENQVVEDRVMDSNALERERGITILSKNASCNFNGVKINVVDTPGHADFGGEVERVLKMVDGVLLVVDAYEGPMPQTRFVLEKALELNLKVIVVVNKIDRPDARISEVKDEVLELLMDLNASDDQLDAPFVYCSAREGVASLDTSVKGESFKPLFETILKYIPAPEGDPNAPLQMLVSSAEHNDYVGKLGVGKIEAGEMKANDQIIVCNYHDESKLVKSKIVTLFTYEGLKRVPVEKATIGDIVCVAGVEDIMIGDTICAVDHPNPLEFVKIAEPSVEMTFLVNNSPFAGKEGKFVTSRHLRDRLYKEAVKDLSLRVSDTSSTEAFTVCGRGEMHLSILIENMRRDGYEFQVSQPRVRFKEIDGKKCEPVDRLTIDVPEEFVGAVMEKVGLRKGEMTNMAASHSQAGYSRLEFKIPARGLIGYRGEFMTDTKGNGIMNHTFSGYEPYKGDMTTRQRGAVIAFEQGKATGYGLYQAQERATLFIGPGTAVYVGMIVGENSRSDDLTINVCKEKHLTNTRASGSDDALKLVPPKIMSLEQSLEFIGDDELVEVTPLNIRLRKKILDPTQRFRQQGKK